MNESNQNEAQPHYHIPVLPNEIVEWMQPAECKIIVDGTLGGGGHTELFLEQGASVCGMDRDPEAIAYAEKRLRRFGDRLSTFAGNFSQMRDIPAVVTGGKVDGILLDLGVSSHQLDCAERGFSFMRDGSLDMRMGPSSRYTAADVINTWSEADLMKIFFEFGEEPRSRRIAAGLVERRAEKPFRTTLDLAQFIEKLIGRHGKTHPATRVFQAVRMAVNEELDSLAKTLEIASSLLNPGGRLLVITFHSLEDRMVKRFMKLHSTPFLDHPSWPEPKPNPDCCYALPSRKAIVPSAQEISINPRSRSSKLRVAQRLNDSIV